MAACCSCECQTIYGACTQITSQMENAGESENSRELFHLFMFGVALAQVTYLITLVRDKCERRNAQKVRNVRKEVGRRGADEVQTRCREYKRVIG